MESHINSYSYGCAKIVVPLIYIRFEMAQVCLQKHAKAIGDRSEFLS